MRNTTQYILKRLLYMIPMVLVITFLIYGGLELTPGDAISHMIPPDQLANVNPEQLEALRESYGLNDPFLLRYVRWLGELLHGNFGYSITSGVPIKDILLQLFPATLELSLAALAISSVLGSILGILSALKKGSIGDNVLTVFGMIGVSIPQFFFGMLCILVFALDWAILPIGGRMAPGETGIWNPLQISDFARQRAGNLPHRRRHALFPFQYAGYNEQGLHQDSTGQGSAGVADQPGPRVPGGPHPCSGVNWFPSAHPDRRLCRH